jgi:hypothetical protein
MMLVTPHGQAALSRQRTCAVRCAVSNHEETYNCIHETPLLAVIASAAKQSILSLRGKMDCFASLAMTARAMDCVAAAPVRPGPD